VWALAQRRGDGHRSLVTPERVLSEYNEDLIWFFFLYEVLYVIVYSLFTWYNKSGLFGGLAFNQQIRVIIQKAPIGRKKAGPPKKPLLFWSCKQAISYII